jgi:hypothetical protein
MWAVWKPILSVFPFRPIIKHVFPEQASLLLILASPEEEQEQEEQKKKWKFMNEKLFHLYRKGM